MRLKIRRICQRSHEQKQNSTNCPPVQHQTEAFSWLSKSQTYAVLGQFQRLADVDSSQFKEQPTKVCPQTAVLKALGQTISAYPSEIQYIFAGMFWPRSVNALQSPGVRLWTPHSEARSGSGSKLRDVPIRVPCLFSKCLCLNMALSSGRWRFQCLANTAFRQESPYYS